MCCEAKLIVDGRERTVTIVDHGTTIHRRRKVLAVGVKLDGHPVAALFTDYEAAKNSGDVDAFRAAQDQEMINSLLLSRGALRPEIDRWWNSLITVDCGLAHSA